MTDGKIYVITYTKKDAEYEILRQIVLLHSLSMGKIYFSLSSIMILKIGNCMSKI